jgi:anti-sigma-K factor RskA
MNAHDEMLDNVAVYALGALPPDEARAVAAHLLTCTECLAEYEALRPAVTATALSAEVSDDASPGPLLKARIMREVRGSSAVPSAASVPVQQRFARWATLAAALVFAVGAVYVAVTTFGSQAHRDAAVIATQQQALADVTAPDAKRYTFGHGAVFVRGAHVYVTMPNMPMPPKGKVYEAWTLPKGSKKMAPSMTFMPANRDATIVRLPQDAGEVTAVAVSVEPAGGSLQPTSKPIAVAVL